MRVSFGAGLRALGREFPEIAFAVENMYPVRVRGREFVPYVPGWDPTEFGFESYTLDLSHCAASRSDAIVMADAMGPGLSTSTSATAPVKAGTNIWCRDAAINRAPSCWRHWVRAGTPGPSRSRWRPGGHARARLGRMISRPLWRSHGRT